jgi:predicted dienelactone hydrolase
MKAQWLSLVLICFLCSCGRGPGGDPTAPGPYSSSVGPYGAVTESLVLTDASRGWDDNGTAKASREIPIKMYAPAASAAGSFPVVLVSHGLGGNADESVAYMAADLAEHGYIVVSVQHHRSDSDYLAEVGNAKFMLAASEHQTRELRPADISFALDWLSDPAKTAGHIVDGRMDLSKVGALGHSFGAWTTLACLGQSFDGGSNMSDPRILCGVAYSPQGAGTLGVDADAWGGIAAPTLTMGGTLDTSPGTTDPADRRAAFDGMPSNGKKYHATLLDAEHSDFGNGSSDGFYHDWIEQMTLAFFDANLKGRAAAKAWLDSKDIEAVSSSYVTLESK